MPLLKELRRTSRDSFESDSDSKESRDVRLNSFKSGILRFFDSIDSIIISIRSILRLSVVVDRPGIDEILFREFRPELRDLLASFQRYDKDHSGQLDQEESMMVLSDAGLLPKTRADRMMIDELMADMD